MAPGWPESQRSSCLSLLSDAIKGMYHHSLIEYRFYAGNYGDCEFTVPQPICCYYLASSSCGRSWWVNQWDSNKCRGVLKPPFCACKSMFCLTVQVLMYYSVCLGGQRTTSALSLQHLPCLRQVLLGATLYTGKP